MVERWNGTTWAIQPTPKLSAGQGSFFNGVACTASACTAVGLYLTNPGPLTLAERWTGTSWRIQATPTLTGAYDLAPPTVACPSASACIAVGGYTANTPNLTLAERWNGATSGSQPATSRLATQGGLAFACEHFLLNLGAYAWRLSHARPWHRSAAQGLPNPASPTGLGTLGWCLPM